MITFLSVALLMAVMLVAIGTIVGLWGGGFDDSSFLTLFFMSSFYLWGTAGVLAVLILVQNLSIQVGIR